MILRADRFSIGKTDRRNDDMCFTVPLFQTQMLGVLGDFTSDSPQGVNEACQSHLLAFIKDKLATWREMLLPPERMLPLLLRKTNDWLGDFGQKAQTTLIVYVWDLRAETCHFISVGDSGLACIGPEGVRYLREGDRQGLRISAGFLPGQVDGTVMVAPVRAGECLIAFSDGFWENTQSFMNDALLSEVFSGNSLAQISARVQQQLIEPANRKDDLSILLMKGEKMEGTSQRPIDQDQLEQLVRNSVEQQVNAAIGSGQSGPPTALERDLLKWLEDAPQLERRFLETLAPQISRTVEAQLTRLFEAQRQQFQNQLDEQSKQLSTRIREQEALVNGLKQQLAQASPKRGNFPDEDIAPRATKTKAKAASPQVESSPTQPKVHTIKGKNPKATVFDDKPWLSIAIVAVAIVCIGLFVWYAFFKGKINTGEGPINQEVSNPATNPAGTNPNPGSQNEEPEPPPPARIDYEPAPISRELLTAMGIDAYTYRRETAELQKAVDALPVTDGPQTIQHSSLGSLTLNLPASLNTRPLSTKMVAKLWLQAHSGAALDGQPGNGTRTKFAAKFKPHMDACKNVAEQAPKGVTSPLDGALIKAYGVTEDLLQSEMRAIALKVLKKGAGKEKLPIAFYRGKRYLATTLQIKETPLASWLIMMQGKGEVTTGDIDIYFRAAWLAAQLDVASNGGQMTPELLKAIDPFGAKSCEALFNEGLVAWK